MGYKVGDKVRIVKFPDKEHVGMICEVLRISSPDSAFCCRVKGRTGFNCLMFSNEIEKVITKGQQLMLFEL